MSACLFLQHLQIFQIHKSVFEVILPNKVTKIMAVPPHGTVGDAIKPVLIKHGYILGIMELRFANNFKVSKIWDVHVLVREHAALELIITTLGIDF